MCILNKSSICAAFPEAVVVFRGIRNQGFIVQ